MTPLEDALWTLALERAAADPAPTNVLRDLLWRSLHLSGWHPRALGVDAPAPANNDRALLERFVHGDPEAFESLVERHGGALVSFARRSLTDEYAVDAAQEAFLALFTKAHEVIAAPDRSVQGFLFRAARSVVIESLCQLLHDEAPPDALLDALPSDDADGLEPLRAVEPSELATRLLATCTALEQDVVLKRLHGGTPLEIAATFELELGHVLVLEHRATTKLAAADPR